MISAIHRTPNDPANSISTVFLKTPLPVAVIKVKSGGMSVLTPQTKGQGLSKLYSVSLTQTWKRRWNFSYTCSKCVNKKKKKFLWNAVIGCRAHLYFVYLIFIQISAKSADGKGKNYWCSRVTVWTVWVTLNCLLIYFAPNIVQYSYH